jgi:ATP-binding cassette subfamily B (MDR/TAP) protein 1
MFESLMRREISYFDDERNGVGALTTRLANDARLVHKGTGEALANQFKAFFTLLTGVIIAFISSWKIALVVIATFPITVFAASIDMKGRKGMG